MRTILISGGNGGIGQALIHELKNDKIIILGRNKESLKKVSILFNCEYFVCDITDADAINQTVAEIIQKYDGIDILINNAGVYVRGPLDEIDTNKIKNVIDINVSGTLLLTRAFIPQFKKQKHGHIINIGSQSGFNARAERTVYTASKWAITGFTKSLFEELKPFGIQVTGIYPASVQTEIFSKANVQKDLSNSLTPRYVASRIRKIIESPKGDTEIHIQ